MTRFETIMAVLNLVAIVGIPILAVVIGQYPVSYTHLTLPTKLEV